MARKQTLPPHTFVVPVPVHSIPMTPPPIVPVRPTVHHRHDVYVGTKNRQVRLRPILFAGFFAAVGTTLGAWQRHHLVSGLKRSSGWMGENLTRLSARLSKVRPR